MILRHQTTLALAIAVIATTMIVATSAYAAPISATGWNVDFVLGNGETYAAHSKPENGNIWFSSGLGITPGAGIPAGGAVTVSGVDFQIESFTGGTNNVLRSTAATNTLSLNSPGMFSELSVLGSNTGGSAGDPWQLVLNFSDAPSSSPITYSAFGNWAGSGPGLNPQLTSNGTSSNFGGQLNTIALDLETLGFSGFTLDSIGFLNTGGAGGNLAVFGVSGVATVVPEPTSIAIWSLLGLALVAFGCYRAQPKA